MHTVKVIASGLLLLAICLVMGRMLGGPSAIGASVKVFILKKAVGLSDSARWRT